MADLDYLDNLSNRELRNKCLEHGLPNVPITDSSRKIMLRRLRAAMLGTTDTVKKTPKTNRRETVHNTAATRAAKSPTRVNNNDTSISTRRTIATVPTTTKGSKHIETTSTLSSSDIGSQSEEDDYVNMNAPKYTHGIKTASLNKPDDSRQRRSVSLTKTGVLTTSYTQETKPIRRYIETEEVDSETELQNTDELPSYSILSSQRNATDARPLPIYEPKFERTYQQTNYSTPPLLTQTQLNSTSYSAYDNNGRYEYKPSSMQRNTIGAGLLGSSNLRQNVITTSNIASSTMPPPATPPLRSTLASPGLSGMRRSTPLLSDVSAMKSTAPNIEQSSNRPSLYPNLHGFYEQQANADSARLSDNTDSEDDLDGEITTARTPYLSNFSRSLETSRREVPLQRSPLGRRSLIKDNEIDVNASFSQFVRDLERKYHLKQTFAILLTVMLAIFIYVLFS